MATNMNIHTDNKPWYKHFWPCFLVGILFISVCVSLTMVYVAIKNSDGLVKDDYYKDGLAINQVLVHDKMATDLKLQAEVRITNKNSISVTLFHEKDFVLPNSLSLDFIFPTRDNRDQTITLKKISNGNYQGSATQSIDGHWYVELKPDATSWRLTGEIYLPQQSLILLKPRS